jgi:phage recombination protein Bet
MTTDVQTANTELAIRGDQTGFDEAQKEAILAQLGVDDAPDADVRIFFHQAKRTGLDPFAKQIHMIGRYTKVKSRENGREVERYVTRYTIQTGIEGYRLIADRAAYERGDVVEFEGPFWCGEDMQWHDAWPKSKGTPEAAKFVVVKNGKPVVGVCHFDEYVQTYKKDGNEYPNSTWSKMPRNQLAKCAEAAALRRAYPNDLSGIHLEDAAVIIDQEGNVERSAPPRRARGTGGLRDAAAAAQQPDDTDPVDAEVVPDPEPDDGTSGEAGADGNWTPEARRKGLNRMHQLFGKGDLPKDDREDRLIVTSHIIGRPVTSSNELTDAEIARTNHQLNKWDNAEQLGSMITEILNNDAIAKADAAESENTTATTDNEGAK